MRARAGIVMLTLGLLWAPAVAAQQPKADKDFSFAVGTRTWITTGYSTDSVQGGGVDPVSELRWRGVDSLVQEINAELVWKRLVLIGSAGSGAINEGVLIDEDFALSDREGRFSRTRSSVEDKGLFYATGDLGVRMHRWREAKSGLPGYVDLFIGYQYWHEKYVAFGATGILDLSPFGVPLVLNNTAPRNVKVITHDYYWQSIRVGLRDQVPLIWGISLKGKFVLIPYSWFELNDVHHLRTDLKKNPSFVDKAEGGFGLEVDGALTATLWRGLSVDVGYRYWGIGSGTGDAITRALTGTIRDRLNEDTTERYGPYFGLQYRF